jgi:hypothetical protein
MARSDVVGAVDSYAGSLHLPVSGVGFGQLSFWEIWGRAAGALFIVTGLLCFGDSLVF